MKYKKVHGVIFPPFSFFCNFLHDTAMTMNDPGFDYGPMHSVNTHPTVGNRPRVTVRNLKTDIQATSCGTCFIHNGKHSIHECRVFRGKPWKERRTLMIEKGICFRCC